MSLQLRIENVDAGYGAVRALHGVSISVAQGETVTLLGTNGNGKSTLLKCVMGMVRPTRGSVVLELDDTRHDLTRLSQAYRRGEPAARRLPSIRPRGDSGEHRVLLRDVPPAPRAPPPARRLALRRTAADARDRARAHVLTAAPRGGRAFGRPRAHSRFAHHRQDPGAERAPGADRADGGAEFPP